MTHGKSREKLRAASDHLWYEIAMFFAAARFLCSQRAVPVAINNAMVEAFAIHFRVCYDFFFKPGREDDVVAAHFFSAPNQWEALRRKPSAFLRKQHGRAHKELAHLTYGRQKVTGKAKEWDARKILDEMRPVVDAFEGALAAELRGSRWLENGLPSHCGWEWLAPPPAAPGSC